MNDCKINVLNIVDKCLKELADRALTLKTVASILPKKNLMIVAQYLGKLCFQVCTKINRVMKNKLPYCNLCIPD